MRAYETAFLIAPNLSEEEVKKVVDQVTGIVKEMGGEIFDLEEWGKRKLAYPIDHFEEAYYFFLTHESPPSVPHELERKFRQWESVIRFMTVKLDKHVFEERKK
ncbi:30S ribosomal protein S6, partial [Candidatus Aminicenantes bacterium AC-335-G13]|nr:30S ribosomal protein S6 [Candidatus Aminicenantes bacterium AC-335-G13]